MTCLDENSVVEFIQGLLGPEEVARIEKHVDGCPSCRELLGEAAKLSIASSRGRVGAADDPGTGSTLRTGETLAVELPHSVLPGQVLAGRFRVIHQLGCGSFGAVYEAEDLQLKERIALKLLRPEIQRTPSLLKHLHHEIVVGRRVSHPNVCRMYDLGAYGETSFITMALIPGDSLDVFLLRQKPTLEQGVALLFQVIDALDAAHTQGVVHRDLKPSNIMVDETGKVTVMDFGLARDLRAGPSQSGALIGSPAYWSPEQAQGERATEQSDIYSFGLMACDVLGVERPSFGGALHAPGLPAIYQSVIERCLKLPPEERFSSADKLRRALRHAKRGIHIKRLRRKWSAAAAGLVLVLGLGAAWLIPRGNPGPSHLTASSAEFDGGAVRSQPVRARIPAISASAPVEPASSSSVKARSQLRKRSKARRSAGRRKKGRARSNAQDAAASPRQVLSAPLSPGQVDRLTARLKGVEQARLARGIHLDDTRSYRVKLLEGRKALRAGEIERAVKAIAGAEESLRRIQIDDNFVSRKLQRLNRLKGSLQLDAATEKQVTEIFAKVHDRYFSGDFKAANTHLNRIWQVLGRVK